VPFGRYTPPPPTTSRSCRSTRTRPVPTRGGRSGRRGAGTPSEATGNSTGALLVAHRGSPTPEVLHQPQLLECEVVAEPRKRALKVLPRPPQKGRFRCGRACQGPQYVLAQEYLPRVGWPYASARVYRDPPPLSPLYLRLLAGLAHYELSRTLTAPPGPTPVVKGSAVVVIGVDRGQGGPYANSLSSRSGFSRYRAPGCRSP
jgi:hypothetical protein